MDRFIFEVLHSLADRSVFVDDLIGFLAKYLIYFLVAGLLVYLYRMKSSARERVFAFITLTLSAVLSRGIFTEVIRFFYDRPRPFDVLNITPIFLDDNPAFPSGHTTFLFALAFALFYFNKKAGWWFTALAFLVALTRVIAGIHWPSDILGGIIVAFISVWLVRQLLKPYAPAQTLTSAS